VRHLVVVLGDQLDHASRAFDEFDARLDCVWMAEVAAESEHVPSHKARTALFLSAMRHFRDELQARGFPLEYRELGAHAERSLHDALQTDLERLRPARVVLVQPGEHRVAQAIATAAAAAGIDCETRPDTHFFITPAEFASWARGRRELRLEHFYRWMRRRSGLLMDGDQPAGGRWNFDAENRGAFGAAGPGWLPAPIPFPPDQTTQAVLARVEQMFRGHVGQLDRFDWPVTRTEALAALEDFIARRLPQFGHWQDALWQGEPWLYHSRLSAALNLKLLTPREVCAAAERAYREGRADIGSVEGFIRQILGWREFVRGIYWREMPGYVERNALGAAQRLPAFYWTGETDLACLRETIGQSLAFGYAHHIQRLMVTGLFALLWGVRPQEVHEWYLAVYVDAVEWVELPNTLGMSQFADGGLLASKPYAATGKYIARMSNYCSGCRYQPEQAHGADACPFTTLYWDFLARHRERFARHPRLALQVRNLDRLAAAERAAIAARASELRQTLDRP
jgi:deoxyribodipyrimidine photolyase-related protein